MSLINHEDLKRQLASGDITSEFKNILKEVIQTATNPIELSFLEL